MTVDSPKAKRSCCKTVLFAVGGLFVLLLILIGMQPNEFRVTRSVTIAAPVGVVFPLVNQPQRFHEWNPWAKVDPKAKTSFEGPKAGKGSVMRWEGNNEVGAGSMTNLETRPNAFLKFQMDFLKPMKATNMAEFTFRPEGRSTQVTWTMYGNNNFIGKAMGLLFNCDKMVGDQFEKGLEGLKAKAEGRA